MRVPSDNSDSTPESPRWPQRIDSIDMLRGLAMVLMLLDHTREYLHGDSQYIDPTNLSQTNEALFLTRWVTHFSAPVFVFLAGTGAYLLQRTRGKAKGELSRFLLIRGMWLIVLEFTVVRLGINFHLDYGTFFGSMQVIWVIGISMIVLAGLIYLPLPATALIGIAMIAGHNLLDGFHVTSWGRPGSPVPGALDSLWMVLHQPGRFLLCNYPCPSIRVTYPLLPWVGVMAAGYAFGTFYDMRAERRQRLLLISGAVLTLAFMVLRWQNGYGDPNPWGGQRREIFTVLSFLNVTKYPVSLQFLLMTLGPAIAALAWIEKLKRGPVSHGLITFGRVPLFFYLLQFYFVHGLAILLGYLAGQPISYQYTPEVKTPPGVGFDLWVVYFFWIVGVMTLFPLCRGFSRVKSRHPESWLRYL